MKQEIGLKIFILEMNFEANTIPVGKYTTIKTI